MDIKALSGIIAGILGIICYIPYLKDIFKSNTKPHIYSWLVWSILQTTGVIAMIAGGASYGALGLGIGSLFCIFIFFLSFKYGTKDITALDTICLIGSLLAILVWISQKNPLISVILITIIDFVGFIPTYRKSYRNPYSETISLYLLVVASNIFGVIAIAHYNIISTLYIGSLLVTNLVCALILFIGRRQEKQNLIPNPSR